jgi:hypothetical protein
VETKTCHCHFHSSNERSLEGEEKSQMNLIFVLALVFILVAAQDDEDEDDEVVLSDFSLWMFNDKWIEIQKRRNRSFHDTFKGADKNKTSITNIDLNYFKTHKTEDVICTIILVGGAWNVTLKKSKFYFLNPALIEVAFQFVSKNNTFESNLIYGEDINSEPSMIPWAWSVLQEVYEKTKNH